MMSENEPDCVAYPRIKRLAEDALDEIKEIQKHEIPKALELGLKQIKDDLDAIVMDNHHQ